jgi:hypothetical protein
MNTHLALIHDFVDIAQLIYDEKEQAIDLYK